MQRTRFKWTFKGVSLPSFLVAYSIYYLNHSLNEKLLSNICSGEAGRDHRGAVQRGGQG